MKRTILLGLTLQAFNTFAAGDITFKHFDKFLEKKNISETYSQASVINLSNYTEKLKEELKSDYELDRISKNDYKKAKEFLNFILETNENIDSLTVIERQAKHTTNLRILYSIASEEFVGRGQTLFEKITLPIRFLSRTATNVKLYDTKELNKPLKRKAKKEAHFLVDPSTNEYISYDQMKTMTPLEVSKLEVSKDHPYFHQLSFVEKNQGDLWKNIEKYVQKRSEKRIKKKHDIKVKYNLEAAKNVLFLKEIKTSATSPKANVKDAFGLKWKIKWGAETQVEPIANRLYVALGAKFNDLTYSNKKGMEGSILILNPKTDKETCESIATVKKFKSCLFDSKYNFNLSPYIHQTSTITESSVDAIYKRLPKGSQEIISKKDLLGREFITFKTSMVEFNGKDIFTRGGPTPGSTLGAKTDRAARGSLLFNAWILNNDAKDENNKAFLFKKLYSEEGLDYVESQHDLGSSLGKAGHAGRISSLKLGNKFAYTTNHNDNLKLVIKQFTLYRPKAWNKATHSDLLWMAKRMSLLTNEKIKEIVASSNWPDFMQELAVYKLVARKNHLLNLLNVEYNSANIEAPSYKVNFDQTKSLASDFDLDQDELQNYITKHGLSGEEDLFKKGKLKSCKKSHFINFLEQNRYPEGLERRQKRSKDDTPLKNCMN